MSTDTDWLDELLVKLTCGLPDPEVVYGDRWGEFVARNKGIPKIKEAKATILQHESQAVKAAIVSELTNIVGGYHTKAAFQWAGDDPRYLAIKDRLKQLQGDSSGDTPPVIDHRTDMEL